MRRKARLKVLYWPILASTCIILILIGFGPFALLLRPAVSHLWAGGDFEKNVGRWLPASFFDGRTITLPWVEMASADSRQRSVERPAASPRTWVKQNPQRSQLRATTSLDSRYDFDIATQPRSVYSPHALRMEAANEFSQLADVKLFAPRRDDSEELAGIERDSKAGVLFASQFNVSETALSVDSGERGSVYVGDEFRSETGRSTESQRRVHGLGGGWPDTPQLRRDIEMAVRVAGRKQVTRLVATGKKTVDLADWQTSVTDLLQSLTSLPSVRSPEAGPILEQLDALASSGHEAGESMEDRETQIRMLRAAHGLDRRLAIWNAVWRTSQGTVSRVTDSLPDDDEAAFDTVEVQRMLAELRVEASSTEDPEGWQRFLMLDELASTNLGDDLESRRLTAQRFLSRLTWHRLSEAHTQWLDRQSVRNLSIVLRRWAAKPLDYASLLSQIERQESDAIDLGGIDVASAVQTLRFAESREANRIADSLNTHYRNANIRVAVSSDLISRFIPEIDAKVRPVRDQILGADVRGTTVINSDLSLRLVPSASTWKMVLENNGRVDTGAFSRQWPVVIRSDSNASFVSSTPIEITADGALANSTQVDIQSATRVRGVRTEFDSIPLVSSLVRELAMNRYESMAPLAQKIQKNKIRGGVTREVDTRVSEQLVEATATLTRRLIGPLGSLSLSPLVVDMQTTESRLLARYRVAGDWQLAAFTPRPRAPMSSLMSTQIHQSAFNNTLEKLLPSGETKTISDLVQDIRQLFGIENPLAIDDEQELSGDICIQFASTRPITIEIEDDILWVTMRVIRLKQDRAIDLRRFIVRAGYRPQINGMSAQLVREGHLRISGPDLSMRDRLPIRAIFNKVFSAKNALPIIPEVWSGQPSMSGLAVTQLELRDGWLALAIGNAQDAIVTPQIARSQDEDADAPQAF